MDKKKRIIFISTLVVGLITLAIGITFLIIRLLNANAIADGEYLVSAASWTLENEPGVVWKFSEIGKGALTTNNYEETYDFIWALEDGKLKIETDWLYELENEYTYTLDKGAGALTLEDDSGQYKFLAN